MKKKKSEIKMFVGIVALVEIGLIIITLAYTELRSIRKKECERICEEYNESYYEVKETRGSPIFTIPTEGICFCRVESSNKK